MTSPVITLNNYLQNSGRGTSKLSWVDTPSGPANALQWTVTCKWDGKVYGVGVARSKGEAKEIAAQQAYQKLAGL